MAIIRWNPWNIDRFFDDELDMPTFPGLSRLVGQGLNIYETDSEIIAEAALPGIPEDKIDITVDDDNVVRVTGSNETQEEDKNKRKYFMSSMLQTYNYTFRLPKNAASNQEPICEFDNGVLKMTFPKIEKQAPKKISIRKRVNQEK